MNPQIYNVGDKVDLLKEPRIGKFDDYYNEIFTVLEVISEFNVKLDIGKGKTKVVHINKLKHAYTRI